MRVAMSWLREYAALPETATARDVADKLIQAGLEVESVEPVGDIPGPLMLGRVVSFVDEPQKNGKVIRWCTVDVGEPELRGIVCGAHNFAEGDLVVVALPGVVLPGDFEIAARKTYGHVSDGMICSVRELGIGEDHDGILVLDPAEGQPGDDAREVLHLRDDVLDIAVTPDRGYTMSMRGVAREAATAYDVKFTDPVGEAPEPFGTPYPVRLDDPGCPTFAVAMVTGFDPVAPSPRWLQRRVQLAGMRPISLAVDVTNYVMVEFGQPIHGYDHARLSGEIVVRPGRAGEKIVTLDDTTRALDPDDMVVTDDSGPIGLGGVMGGASTELGAATTEVVIEAARWDEIRIARSSRRHKLGSEASRRFERGVDDRIQAQAVRRVAQLLTEFGGGTLASLGRVGATEERMPITIPGSHPASVAGYDIPTEVAVRRLRDVGCTVEPAGDALRVAPPSWRPDLTDPNDFAEEVIRLEGYAAVPSVLPVAPPGRGLNTAQRLRRRVGNALAFTGYVEVLCYPFVGPGDFDRLGLDADDVRRTTVTLANPLSDEQSGLRTTLLPGLLDTARRNVGRGENDLALSESGLVFWPHPDPEPMPRLGVEERPTEPELAALYAGLPAQPRHLAVVLTGAWSPAGWQGPARPVVWADAVQAARTVARTVGVELTVRQGQRAPWHPGRCAELLVAGEVVGYAGELHPRVCRAFEIPARAAAAELDLDAVLAHAVAVVPAPEFSTYPVAKEDVALVVDAGVPAGEVEAALREGSGELLESLRLFDVYAGEQVGEGRKSLAFALRFRAAGRTLTDTEVAEAKRAAIETASLRTGASLRV